MAEQQDTAPIVPAFMGILLLLLACIGFMTYDKYTQPPPPPTPYQQGYSANLHNIPKRSNPFLDKLSRLDWEAGWLDAQIKRNTDAIKELQGEDECGN